MLSNKLYFRLLALFTAVLALSQAGWAVYLMRPKRQEPRPKSFRLPELSSPTFAYSYRELTEDEAEVVTRDVEVPAETGRRILQLLRRSKTYSAALVEYLESHPEDRGKRIHFYPDFYSRLACQAGGPALTVDFLQSGFVVTDHRTRKSETYFVRQANIEELNAILETLDPRIKAAREIERNARDKELRGPATSRHHPGAGPGFDNVAFEE